MERRAPVFSKSLMVSATERAKASIKETIDRAESIKADSKKDDRLAKQLCQSCFYFQRLAGQAITSQSCACCRESQTYSSTATDVLCLKCAANSDLCKHCAGDIDMKSGRRNWPEVK